MTMAMLILQSPLVSVVCLFRLFALVRLCTRLDTAAYGWVDDFPFRLLPVPWHRQRKADVNRIVSRVSIGSSAVAGVGRNLRCASSICRSDRAYLSDSTFHVDADTGRSDSGRIPCKRSIGDRVFRVHLPHRPSSKIELFLCVWGVLCRNKPLGFRSSDSVRIHD